MSWAAMCKKKLMSEGLFADDAHYQRFADAVDCYCDRPFFSEGLCKCIYMSSFDDDHYIVFLQMINGIVARRERNLASMKEQGKVNVDAIEMDYEAGKISQELSLREQCMYQLSSAFLYDRDYELPPEAQNCKEDWVKMFYMSKQAADIIHKCREEYREEEHKVNPFPYQV